MQQTQKESVSCRSTGLPHGKEPNVLNLLAHSPDPSPVEQPWDAAEPTGFKERFYSYRINTKNIYKIYISWNKMYMKVQVFSLSTTRLWVLLIAHKVHYLTTWEWDSKISCLSTELLYEYANIRQWINWLIRDLHNAWHWHVWHFLSKVSTFCF